MAPDVTLGHAGVVHLVGAAWALLVGAVQLSRPKGTPSHRLLGQSWMLAMIVVAVSSFWLQGFMDLFMGLSPIHLLSFWVLFCVAASLYHVRNRNITWHKVYVVGAYVGTVGAGIGAVVGETRIIHLWLIGL
jgi:uncharacterized membrane protein